MGDLQKYLNPLYEGPDQSGSKIGLLRFWPLFLILLIGGAWMFFSWRQVRLARAEKELIRLEIQSLTKIRDRLKPANRSGQTSLAGEEAESTAVDAIGSASEEQALLVGQSHNTPDQVERQTAGPPAQLTSPGPQPTLPAGPSPSVAGEEDLYLLITGADRTLDGARKEVKRLENAEIQSIKIYYRENFYRIVAGPFEKSEAWQLLKKVRAKVNASAYVVSTGNWCEGKMSSEGYIECL